MRIYSGIYYTNDHLKLAITYAFYWRYYPSQLKYYSLGYTDISQRTYKAYRGLLSSVFKESPDCLEYEVRYFDFLNGVSTSSQRELHRLYSISYNSCLLRLIVKTPELFQKEVTNIVEARTYKYWQTLIESEPYITVKADPKSFERLSLVLSRLLYIHRRQKYALIYPKYFNQKGILNFDSAIYLYKYGLQDLFCPSILEKTARLITDELKWRRDKRYIIFLPLFKRLPLWWRIAEELWSGRILKSLRDYKDDYTDYGELLSDLCPNLSMLPKLTNVYRTTPNFITQDAIDEVIESNLIKQQKYNGQDL
jgi:hypothetical protein